MKTLSNLFNLLPSKNYYYKASDKESSQITFVVINQDTISNTNVHFSIKLHGEA